MGLSKKLMIAAGLITVPVAIGLYFYFKREPQPPPPRYIENSNGNTYEPISPNIQVAINDLGTTGGWVRLPPVLFELANDIVIKENISLYGYNQQTEFMFTGNGNYIRGQSNCGLYDIFLRGMGAISFNNCTNSIINNVRAEYIGEIQGAFDPPTFNLINCQNCSVTNSISYWTSKYGVYLSGSQNCLIDGCTISYTPNSYSGIQLQDGSSNNQISNNHIHHIGMDPSNMNEFDTRTARGGRGTGCTPTNNNYNLFINNVIHHIREHGIKIYYNNIGNEIINNEIYEVNKGNLTGPYGSQPEPYGWALDMQGVSLIKGNTIGLNWEAWGGMVIGNDSVGATIENNVISHITPNVRMGACIANQVNDATIRNNMLIGNGALEQFSRGMGSSGNNCHIENNDIERFKRSMYLSSLTNSFVRYNTIKDCERGIRFNNCSGVVATNNTFDCVPTVFEFPEECISCVLEPNTIIPC